MFYWDLKPRGAASFLNGFKNIAGKACVKRVPNNDAFVTLEISIREKH